MNDISSTPPQKNHKSRRRKIRLACRVGRGERTKRMSHVGRALLRVAGSPKRQCQKRKRHGQCERTSGTRPPARGSTKLHLPVQEKAPQPRSVDLQTPANVTYPHAHHTNVAKGLVRLSICLFFPYSSQLHPLRFPSPTQTRSIIPPFVLIRPISRRRSFPHRPVTPHPLDPSCLRRQWRPHVDVTKRTARRP